MEQHRIVGTTRRAVLAGLAAALVPAPLVAQAQPRDVMRRLGVLTVTSNSQLVQGLNAALVQALGALGWHEGSNLHIDWRFAGGDSALVERAAAELVALGPDVVYAAGTIAIAALRRQTRTIPIVFTLTIDPVGQGFVASLAHPGGNVTGFTAYAPPMAGKWLEMLTQITPAVAHVAVLGSPTLPPYDLMLSNVEEAGRSLAVAVDGAPCRDDAEIEAATAKLAREVRGGLLVIPDAFNSSHRDAIITFAAKYRLPAIYPERTYAKDGGLMSYGSDFVDQYRRAAAYLDRILNGEKPGDLPVQDPTKFELVLNLRTAKALGVTFSQSLLVSADEVIE